MSGAADDDEDNKPISLLVPIILKIRGPNCYEDFFRIERDTKLEKLMNVYCETKSVLRMRDGDVIDAMPHIPGPLFRLNTFRHFLLANGELGYDLCCDSKPIDLGCDNEPIALLVPIILKVRGMNCYEDFFRIGRDTKLEKLMNVYCETKSVVCDYYAFLFDGRRLHCHQTPYELRMRDGDVIDAMPHIPGPLFRLNTFRHFLLANGELGYDLCCDSKPIDLCCDNEPIALLVPIILKNSSEDFFRIKRGTKLKKLMNVYCERKSVVFDSYAFMFDGRRLRCDETPYKLRMQDGDVIDAMPSIPGPLANLNAFRYC